jgi:hypothetical protein
MYCRKCGTPNSDAAGQCARCGELLQALPSERIENNLVLAIVVTVLCCLPCGIVGIVYAAQVNPKAMTGDLAGARESAQRAKLWSYWGLGLGFALYAVYALFFVMNILSEAGR